MKGCEDCDYKFHYTKDQWCFKYKKEPEPEPCPNYKSKPVPVRANAT